MAIKKKDELLVFILVATVFLLPVFAEATGEVNDSGGNWTILDFGGGETNDSGGNWTAIGNSGGGEVNDSGGNWTLFSLSVVGVPTANDTPAPTPGVQPSGAVTVTTGGGAGGGAGGISTSKAVEVIGEVKADTPTIIQNTNPNIDLDNVQLVLSEDAKDVKITIELVRDDVTITAPTGQFYAAGAPVVYQYLKIDLGGQEGKVKEATLSFHVEKSWVKRYDIDVSSIGLAHFKSNDWSSLPTEKVSEDANNIYFKAKTTSFSLFAILGKSQAFGLELPSLGDINLPSVGTYCGNFICDSNEDSKSCAIDCAKESKFLSAQTAYSLSAILATAFLLILLVVFVFAPRTTNEAVLRGFIASAQKAGYQPKSALEAYVHAALKAGQDSGRIEGRLLQAGWHRKAVKDIIRRMRKVAKSKK